MAFLSKVQRIKARKKHCIQIDVQQVVKILTILAGKRKGSVITGGKGIHKGIQGAPDHQEKRITDRETLAATQHRMLENMGNAAGVSGHSAQRHHKDVFLVVTGQVKVHRARITMLKLVHRQVQGVDPATALERKGCMAGHGVSYILTVTVGWCRVVHIRCAPPSRIMCWPVIMLLP